MTGWMALSGCLFQKGKSIGNIRILWRIEKTVEDWSERNKCCRMNLVTPEPHDWRGPPDLNRDSNVPEVTARSPLLKLVMLFSYINVFNQSLETNVLVEHP